MLLLLLFEVPGVQNPCLPTVQSEQGKAAERAGTTEIVDVD